MHKHKHCFILFQWQLRVEYRNIYTYSHVLYIYIMSNDIFKNQNWTQRI